MAKKNFRINYPASKKIYINGSIHAIRVGMREIQLTDSIITIDGKEKLKSNKSVTVYDTSGPYSDPKIKIDIEKGLPRLREEWYSKRKDIVQLQEITSDYGKERLNNTSL
ncbi:MAG: phosphomethylpyrimidine synthase ThiC, partial [Tannerellaceae bacterium]